MGAVTKWYPAAAVIVAPVVALLLTPLVWNKGTVGTRLRETFSRSFWRGVVDLLEMTAVWLLLAVCCLALPYVLVSGLLNILVGSIHKRVMKGTTFFAEVEDDSFSFEGSLTPLALHALPERHHCLRHAFRQVSGAVLVFTMLCALTSVLPAFLGLSPRGNFPVLGDLTDSVVSSPKMLLRYCIENLSLPAALLDLIFQSMRISSAVLILNTFIPTGENTSTLADAATSVVATFYTPSSPHVFKCIFAFFFVFLTVAWSLGTGLLETVVFVPSLSYDTINAFDVALHFFHFIVNLVVTIIFVFLYRMTVGYLFGEGMGVAYNVIPLFSRTKNTRVCLTNCKFYGFGGKAARCCASTVNAMMCCAPLCFLYAPYGRHMLCAAIVCGLALKTEVRGPAHRVWTALRAAVLGGLLLGPALLEQSVWLQLAGCAVAVCLV